MNYMFLRIKMHALTAMLEVSCCPPSTTWSAVQQMMSCFDHCMHIMR